MNNIFQISVIRKHLENLDDSVVSKKYEIFKKNYSSAKIREVKLLKEEEYQDGFLRDIFVDCLGYTLKPSEGYNLAREFKNLADSKKADGAVLKDGKAIVVIELKSTKTKDLKSITDQAFNYKSNQPGCNYVVTSNFQKLRFYIDYANEYEEFDLFNLTYDDFKLLYLFLSKDSIYSDLPLTLKKETKFHEEKISDELYKDYSKFKKKLFNNLVEKNPQHDKLVLFKKSQKLLDRFLFILFAEDCGLLPPNSISRIVKRFEILKEEDAYKPIYDIYKQYFEYMNIGRKGKTSADDIPAYNGGLFYLDEELNSLIIDDEFLMDDLMKLSAYDFNTEVDVNILGHIFEHSLSEIEEITAEIEGTSTDKSKSKRKKDGVFYTPKYITQYIVENTIGKLCDEKRTELDLLEIEFDGSYRIKGGKLSAKGKKLYLKLDEYKKWLFELKIVDPACGSGAFLNQALNFLINEHKTIDDIIAELTGEAIRLFDTDKSILENNLFGVDINEESVEIAQLSLWLRTAQKDRKLSVLSKNIKCGNSLIDDPAVAGDKAFNWEKEFPQIFTEKKKKTWHITTATHNSRYSQRMYDNNVQVGEAVWIDAKGEIIITETIAEIVKKDNLNVIEYNICGDHMHLLLVCEQEELTKIVGKLKAVSGRRYNIEKGVTVVPATGRTRGHVPLSDTDAKLLVDTDTYTDTYTYTDTDTEGKKEKKKYNSLWTQKFNRSEIMDEDYLNNAIEYIRNNRVKHKLPKSKEIEKLKKEFLSTVEHAFRTEYNGGFDVVIGNPPYVPAELISEEDKEYLEKTYSAAFGRLNLYPIFYEKGIKILKDRGVLSFITPYTILKNQYYIEARRCILENTSIQTLIDFKGITVFEDAAVDSIILTLKKEQNTNNEYNQITNIKDFQKQQYLLSIIQQNEILKSDDLSFNISPFEKIITIISKGCIPLKEILNFNQGIITGGNSKYLTYEKSELTKSVITGRDFNRYIYRKSGTYIIYDTDKLHRPRKKNIFEVDEKILLRQTGAFPICMIDTSHSYTLDTVHNGLLINDKYSLKYLLSILNSKLLRFLYESSINESGKVFAQVKIIYIDPLPIKIADKETQKAFISNVNKILFSSSLLEDVSNKFIRYLLSQFSIEKLPKKLQNWYKLDFANFIKELNKAIKKAKGTPLSKMDEMEWMEVFETKKAEAQALKAEIDKTDKEIDQMVYDLYELTAEEIKIVEGTNS